MASFLVIAASGGIGQATVSLLKQAGHGVFTTARDTSKITPDAVLDATDFDAVDAVFKQFSGRSSKHEKRLRFLRLEAE